jgi:hypothetical protein
VIVPLVVALTGENQTRAMQEQMMSLQQMQQAAPAAYGAPGMD